MYEQWYNPEQVDPFGKAITRFLFWLFILVVLVIMILMKKVSSFIVMGSRENRKGQLFPQALKLL